MLRDGVGGVDGLFGARSVTVSPDGAHVYAAGVSDDAVAVFSRDPGTGALTFVEGLRDGGDGVAGLFGAFSVTVSPDGAHVYAAGQFDNAVAVFAAVTLSPLAVGSSVAGTTLGGSGTSGGIDFEFEQVDLAGDFQAQHLQIPLAGAGDLLTDPEDVDFVLPSDPIQVWELDFSEPGGFSGGVTLTFGYDESLLLPGTNEETLIVSQYVDGIGWRSLGVPCDMAAGMINCLVGRDTVANTITVRVDGFSQFVLSMQAPTVPALPPWALAAFVVLMSASGAVLLRRRGRSHNKVVE